MKRSKRGGIRCLALALATSACGGASERPHVVLITVDTLRADHLSMNGYPRATSPALDAFARSATRFTRATATVPKTCPSMTTIFTGLGAQEHGVRFNFTTIPAAVPLVAERFRALGYRTAAFVSNPVLRPAAGFARGFGTYRFFEQGDVVRDVTDAFREWSAADWDTPTFVWIHYLDPHGPYEPPTTVQAQLDTFLADDLGRDPTRVSLDAERTPEEKARRGSGNKLLGAIPLYQQLGAEDRRSVFVARYDAEIRLVDAAFGEVVDALRARGVFEPSLVLFTADHGESLGEHELWFAHGWFPYQATLHVPFVVKEPGQTRGRTIDALVSHLDVLPTLERFVPGLGAPPGRGHDVFQLPVERAPILIENSDRYPVKFLGLRTERWKYLVRQNDGAEELYDLDADPHETENLAARETERISVLRTVLANALRRARSGANDTDTIETDDAEALDRIRALGY